MQFMDSSNVFTKRQIFRAAAAGRPMARGVESAAADLQCMAKIFYRKLFGVCFNGRVLYRFSCFKYASNFFRMATSCWARASCRLSRTTSLSWPAGLRPRDLKLPSGPL